ncbi:glycosyltransferase family 2 protein [Microbacterium deminutum]|uniref:glycosyltransferase family 2 protein n=1 Tax=Microbacterium deminutum TaxID=344164 RepID=UPI0031D9E970
MSIVEALFGGLPAGVQVFFLIVLLVDIASLVGVIVLLVAAARFRAIAGRKPPGDESAFLWVFLVPALNEEVTIADSVERLRSTRATNALFVIIDDGSDDRTGEILATIDDPRLRVLTRAAPEARQGKAAALNAAYRRVRESLSRDPVLARWSEDRVIVTIVDADGRLDPAAPAHVVRHFEDPAVGGVQVLVRIYNRRGPLTWAQDVEFSSFGLVFQAGRSCWGVANMGGNGQFNRLSALATIDEDAGPWRDRLTEDQDLGVRLIQAGWAGVHENGTSIDQQGLNSVRRLYRQRTRWAQGNWQAMALLRGALRPRLPALGRIDTVFYLLTPALPAADRHRVRDLHRAGDRGRNRIHTGGVVGAHLLPRRQLRRRARGPDHSRRPVVFAVRGHRAAHPVHDLLMAHVPRPDDLAGPADVRADLVGEDSS